jgi:hypothetical protein
MDARQKTAAHLERMILMEIRRYVSCTSVSAVTVRPTGDNKSWEVADLYAPGGVVSSLCRDIAMTAAAALRERYDLLPEDQLAPDDEVRLL